MQKPKIIFTYLLTGEGHFAPARAIQEYISDSYANSIDTVLSDFLSEIGEKKLENNFIKSWDNFFTRYPLIIKQGHKIISSLPFLVRLWMHIIFRKTIKSAARYIEKENPTIVFSSHSFTAFILEKVKKRFKYDFTLISISTDPFSSHVFFEQLKDHNFLIVTSTYSHNRLEKAGINREKILQFPFPINQKFSTPITEYSPDIDNINLDRNKKTLLVSFGGWGVGAITKHIQAIKQLKIPLNIIVVCGKNENLKSRLLEEFGQSHNGSINLFILGFVTNMHELISISDISFIKPGASTTIETMVMQKPILFYESIAHIETANVQFAVDNGLGIDVGKNIDKFISALRYYIEDNGISKTVESYKKMNLKNGTKEISDFLVSIIKKKN